MSIQSVVEHMHKIGDESFPQHTLTMVCRPSGYSIELWPKVQGDPSDVDELPDAVHHFTEELEPRPEKVVRKLLLAAFRDLSRQLSQKMQEDRHRIHRQTVGPTTHKFEHRGQTYAVSVHGRMAVELCKIITEQNDDLDQLAARRNEGLRIIEQLRAENQQLRAQLKLEVL